MFKLENFGITLEYVTTKITIYAICALLGLGLCILLWCLFCIGLARIAKKRGEQKEWFAYLPLLRLYTLGKMSPGSEKVKRFFACFLPTLAVVRAILYVVCAGVLARAAAGIIFAAENMTGSTIALSELVTFPFSYSIAALIIAILAAFIYRAIYAFCYYGAIKHAGAGKAIAYAVIAFFLRGIAAIIIFAESSEKRLLKAGNEAKKG
ncbi:MAG: hypothetical protein J5662_04025 [Clostridia bacterium]|nr:hypothetical protein [Clostridia bacterium]